jgi:hypothetical protein
MAQSGASADVSIRTSEHNKVLGALRDAMIMFQIGLSPAYGC